MSSAFDNQILAEKLNKLNNSQQSIESLSSWCISHRKKAEQVVETWEKLFNSSPKERKVSFLYLANDILQNSRRKGSEFVNEFWKVLPGALKNVYETGEDLGKTVVMRLVGIWDERKVFGSRGRGLKNEILGKESVPPPLLDNNGKSSNSIKVVRKDAQTVRLKLAVGGMPEKIVTAYQSVLDEQFDEDTTLNKCRDAIDLVGRIEKDVDVAGIHGNQQGSLLVNELQEQETVLKQCINYLKILEASRAALITHLKESLQEQESMLENIRTQMQVAETEIVHSSNLRQRILSAVAATISSPNTNPSQAICAAALSVDTNPMSELNQTSNGPPYPHQPVTSFTCSLTHPDEQQMKAAAAAMAAKLTASTSSALMLTSVLSSLVAEEAASKNGSLSSSGGCITSSSPPMFPAEKRPKLEKPMPVADISNSYFGHMQQQQQQMGQSIPLAAMPPVPVSTMQQQQQPHKNNQPMPSFTPSQPPLPPVPPPPHFMQTSGGHMPFRFPGNPHPPQPPLPSSMGGLSRPPAGPPTPPPPPPPPPPLPPVPPPQHQQQQPQQPSTAGFYQPPTSGFYGQMQQSAQAQRQ